MKNSINIKTQNTEYVLNFNNVLNVIVGDSSTGKTSLFETLNKKLYKSITHTFTDILYLKVKEILNDMERLEPDKLLKYLPETYLDDDMLKSNIVSVLNFVK